MTTPSVVPCPQRAVADPVARAIKKKKTCPVVACDVSLDENAPMISHHAIVARHRGCAFEPHDPPPRSDRVRVAIALAGLCRTDVQAMTGLSTVPEGRVLGHEAAGTVQAIPPSLEGAARAAGLSVGTRVAIFPFLPCGDCPSCLEGCSVEMCHRPSALGLDEDGAFAPTVDLPVSVLFPIPPAMGWDVAAFAEPAAAALAVLGVPAVRSAEQVAVLGSGRIAEAVTRALAAGYPGRPVARLLPGASAESWSSFGFDVVIETVPTEQALALAAEILRPGGTIVVKSRPRTPVVWPHRLLVLKRLTVVGAAYAPFKAALAMLADGRFDAKGLLGERFEWSAAGVRGALHREQSSQEHAGKLFFAISQTS